MTDIKVEVDPSEVGFDAARLQRLDDHFRRYVGRRVRIRTLEPIDGAKSFSGELVEAADDAVSVAADAGIVRIPFADIHKSNLLEG